MTTTNRIPVLHAYSEELDGGAFAVVAIAPDHLSYQHEGPGRFPYFTKEQAAKLINRVREAGSIDPARWSCLNRSWAEIEADWSAWAEIERQEEGRI